MFNEDYHEPIAAMTDAARDLELKEILTHNHVEEKEHAAMLLEWIRRTDSTFSKELKDCLFTNKPIAHSGNR